MFNEDEDWSDEQDAQVLSKTVLKNTQKESSSSANVKSKAVGKKSLLRTLQTLGSVPDWKSDDHQQGSDSETEVAPSHTKRKKKRRKRRKQAETTGEQQENGDVDQSLKEEKPEAKKRKKDNKFGASKVKSTSVSETKDKDVTKSAKVEANKSENTDKMNRQQWKNKMKNKRKCKNKYRQDKPEEDVNKAESVEKHKPKEEVKTESNSSKSEKISQTPGKRKEKEPQQRKKTEVDTDISCLTGTQTLREEKQFQKQKNTKKVEKVASESPADGSKQTAEEPEVKITDDQHQFPMKRLKPELSKEQSLKKEKLRKMLHSLEMDQKESPAETKEEPAAPEEEVILDRSASLRSRMEQRLESARFRYINEVMYSTSSGDAKRMFKQDPDAFWVYHRGYTAQVQKWPTNPVDQIIAYIRTKPPSLVVADFGCGDCKIARSVNNKVHSFDLAATCELVTVCDMANVPLRDASVDIAVFCLSLMGTNLADFLAEANRVLKMGGVLKIAEVASRFENVRSFMTGLANLGFKLVSKDSENTHFYSFELLKTGNAPENIKTFGLQLKPCVYKKR
ncbi:uncharacterized protein rrp8 [Pagrus major]|uniref:uncharacterized protein rrp8 n=1 Tax=Pagrus major TaxID=143350 RepID=UPI003CC882CF